MLETSTAALTTKLNVMYVLGIVWHYWIAPPLVAGGVLLVIATAFGYYKRVVHQRYPPESAVLESAKEMSAASELSASELATPELQASEENQ